MRLEDLLNGETSRQRRRPKHRHHHHHHHHTKEVAKLEDFLTEEGSHHKKKQNLEKEVMKLKGELEDEQDLNKALRTALSGPVLSQPRLSLLLLPPQVQELIEELGTVEAEILCLEKRVEDLKIGVYEQRKSAAEEPRAEAPPQKKSLKRQNHLPCDSRKDDLKQRSRSQNYEEPGNETTKNLRRVSTGSAMEFVRANFSGSEDEFAELTMMHTRRIRPHPHSQPQAAGEIVDGKANKISEELIRCLMRIFLRLNKACRDREGSATVPKLSLQFAKSSSFNRSGATLHPYNHNASNLDPYGVLSDSEIAIRDVGAYKDFIHITRGSIDVSRLSDCSTEIVKLRVWMEKLYDVDLGFLSYKQKLAFWINVFNACVINAFLEYGLPSTQTKLLALLNKASLNVGGTVLKALDIEHCILHCRTERQPKGLGDENEKLIQEKYDLNCSEPNVAFALCRGTWSSPALRIYTSETILDDLERAKVEFLEASVGVSSKGKTSVPKLVHSHVRDFAGDAESVVQWIYHQVPRGGSVRDVITETLRRKDATISVTKMVEAEVQPYGYEFRYLLPLD